MSKILVDTIDTRSGTTTLTLGGTNTTTIAFGSNVTTTPSSLTNTPSFLATRSSNQTISHASTTKIQFDSEVIDTDSAYDNSTNYRFTVPSGKAGKYLIGIRARLLWDGSNGMRDYIISIYKNGSLYARNEAFNFTYELGVFSGPITEIIDLSVGDYVEAYIYQETNGSNNQTIQSSLSNSSFWGYKLI